MQTIYLIGFMGAGKTTIGHLLAEYLQTTFIDLDDYIEKTYQMRIPEIFNNYGEKTFRDYETKALQNVKNVHIVATGGGVVERQENIKSMKKGIIIYLETSFEEIKHRLRHDSNRPLWNISDRSRRKLFFERIEKYKKIAHIRINTTNKPKQQVVQEIISYV